MKFSRKDQRTLLYIVGVLLIIAVYFLYFTNKQSELDEAQSEVKKLESEVSVLRNYEKSMKTYERETNSYYDAIGRITVNFPEDVKEENIFMYARELETDCLVGVTDVTIGEQTQMYAVGKGKRQKKMYVTQAQMVFGGNYTETLSIIDKMMNFPLKRNIVAMTLTSDEETGLLVGNITMDLFKVKGEGQTYEKPYTGVTIPGSRLDIFN